MNNDHLRALCITVAAGTPMVEVLAQEGGGDDTSTALKTGTAIGAVLVLALVLVVLLRILMRPR